LNQKGTVGNSKGVSNITSEFITSTNENVDGKKSKASFGSTNPTPVSVDAYEEMRMKENMAARHAILANLSYVEL